MHIIYDNIHQRVLFSANNQQPTANNQHGTAMGLGGQDSDSDNRIIIVDGPKVGPWLDPIVLMTHD